MLAATPTNGSPKQRTASMQPARCESAQAAADLYDLPRDVWSAIARLALNLEGDDARAWARLSLVNSAWCAGTQGVLHLGSRTPFAAPGVPCGWSQCSPRC